MLANGNAEVGPCAACLLSAQQREIPYARSKGIDPDVMDMPMDDVAGYLDETARNALSAYEPRVSVDTVLLEFEAGVAPHEAPYKVHIVQTDGEGDE